MLEKQFINHIQNYGDFVCAYILKEDKNVIWIVIKDAKYEYNVKYLRSERQFKKNNNCDFETIIFSEDEIEEIKEQLKYMGEYEYINDFH
jgi:predicted transcriptional regulator